MEEESLPPLFPEGSPIGEPVQLRHEELTFAAETAAACMDYVDSTLHQAVAMGAITEEEATAHHTAFVEGVRQKLTEMEAGRYVPDPDYLLKLGIARSELALSSLDLFDRAGRADVEAGRMTEEEFAIRRQELLDRINKPPDSSEGQGA